MVLAGRHLGGGAMAATPYDGQFLKAFDFEAHDGQGLIDLTDKIEDAMRFADLAEAVNFRNRSPECQPLRPDGHPNRPLTSTNWELRTL